MEMTLRDVKATLRCACHVAAFNNGTQVEAQQPSDLAVEVHFTSLDTGSKKRALAYFENFSGQTEAIGLDEPANTDTVSDFNLCHGTHSFEKVMRANYTLCHSVSRVSHVILRQTRKYPN